MASGPDPGLGSQFLRRDSLDFDLADGHPDPVLRAHLRMGIRRRSTVAHALGNLVNSAATVTALWQFWRAFRQNRSPAWQKTEHVYPGQVTAVEGRPRLGEVLVRMQCVSVADLEVALQSCPKGLRLGEHLMFSKKLSEEHLYQALSSQAGIPLGAPDSKDVHRLATRILPAEAARRWKVMPYRVAVGQLHVLTPNVPSERMERELACYSDLEIRFRLVRPREFEAMARKYLPRAVGAAELVEQESMA